MLATPTPEELEAIAELGRSPRFEVYRGWLARSREALRDQVDDTRDDLPLERGASKALGMLLKQHQAAAAQSEKLKRPARSRDFT